MQSREPAVELAHVWFNYCDYLSLLEGPRRALEEWALLLDFARARGMLSIVGNSSRAHLESLMYAGRWQEAIDETTLIESAPEGLIAAAHAPDAAAHPLVAGRARCGRLPD